MLDRIVTHDDFDGVASAALTGYFMDIGRVSFAGPGDIQAARVSTGMNDIVCDLPYPLQCGMWFDHHEANLEEVRLRGIDPDSLPGLRLAAPSCARVVRDWFAREFEIEPDLEYLIDEADRIDSFGYATVDQWRAETPAHCLDAALKNRDEPPQRRREFLRRVAAGLIDEGLDAVAAWSETAALAGAFRRGEERMLKTIRESFSYLDPEHEIILLDFTGHARRAVVVKNLAQLIDPAALAVLEVNSMFERGVKTTGLVFSMSLNIASFSRPEARDLGAIMRALDIGSGHAGAASGRVDCGSKPEMFKARQRVLDGILAEWKKQGQA